jgi:hypothetical protein
MPQSQHFPRLFSSSPVLLIEAKLRKPTKLSSISVSLKKHPFTEGALSYCVSLVRVKGDHPMKKYTKPELKKHAELKSVTFSSH